MPLPLYLLRRPAASVSSALYDPEQGNRSVCIVTVQSEDHSSSEEAVLIKVSTQSPLQDKRHLDYTELLDVILKEDRVVTL